MIEEYRVLFLARDGRIVSQTIPSCANDADAIVQAKPLVGGFAIQLWSRNRLIKRFEVKLKRHHDAPDRNAICGANPLMPHCSTCFGAIQNRAYCIRMRSGWETLER
jgi:hypothetical protein